ncbi:MAG: cold shock domain-containing protein [Calditrichota bacterium]
MDRGVIKIIDHRKGFGFILTADEDEVFFNLQDIHPKFRGISLREGDLVGFDLKREIKGDRAINIRKL